MGDNILWGIGIVFKLRVERAVKSCSYVGQNNVQSAQSLVRQLRKMGFKERLRRFSKGAKAMKKTVIIRKCDNALGNGKQCYRFPDHFRNTLNDVIRCNLVDKCQKPVSRVAMTQEVGKVFLPFEIISPYYRLIFADRIVDQYKMIRLLSYLNGKGRKAVCSEIKFARGGLLL